ncbi:hypothetical protein GTR04_2366 [Trichophyton interdigitale]|nr:hypothetical protein GTR04_2366 [Trichophyton interdigitale]
MDKPMVPDAPVVPGPPELPYSLRSRKRSISIFWTLFIIDTLVQPLVLYFTLWYCTNLSHNLVFTISTAALGGVAVVEYFYRFYNLFKKGSKIKSEAVECKEVMARFLSSEFHDSMAHPGSGTNHRNCSRRTVHSSPGDAIAHCYVLFWTRPSNPRSSPCLRLPGPLPHIFNA